MTPNKKFTKEIRNIFIYGVQYSQYYLYDSHEVEVALESTGLSKDIRKWKWYTTIYKTIIVILKAQFVCVCMDAVWVPNVYGTIFVSSC